MRIFIFGSCVSRDIFNFGGEKFHVSNYFARSSFASAFQGLPVVDKYSKNIRSSFQKNIVAADLEKTAFVGVEEGEYDILLVDFIDERFNIFSMNDGACCTLSVELLSAGFLDAQSIKAVIRSGTDEFYALWEVGWSRFVESLRSRDRLDRLRINKVYWSLATESGDSYSPSYSETAINSANLWLERLYARAALDISDDQFLKFSPSILIGSDNHRWGKSPFHYVDGYYLDALRQLGKSVDRNHSSYAASGQQMATMEGGVNLSNLRKVCFMVLWSAP